MFTGFFLSAVALSPRCEACRSGACLSLQGLGFRAWGAGFRVWAYEVLGAKVYDLSRAWDVEFGVWVLLSQRDLPVLLSSCNHRPFPAGAITRIFVASAEPEP